MTPKEHAQVAEANTLKLAEHFVEAEIALQAAKGEEDLAKAQKLLTIATVHATLATADRAADGIFGAKQRRREAEAAITGAPTYRRHSAAGQIAEAGRVVKPIGAEYTDREWQNTQRP